MFHALRTGGVGRDFGTGERARSGVPCIEGCRTAFFCAASPRLRTPGAPIGATLRRSAWTDAIKPLTPGVRIGLRSREIVVHRSEFRAIIGHAALRTPPLMTLMPRRRRLFVAPDRLRHASTGNLKMRGKPATSS